MYETNGAGVTVYSFMFEVGLIVTIDILIPVLDQNILLPVFPAVITMSSLINYFTTPYTLYITGKHLKNAGRVGYGVSYFESGLYTEIKCE